MSLETIPRHFLNEDDKKYQPKNLTNILNLAELQLDFIDLKDTVTTSSINHFFAKDRID